MLKFTRAPKLTLILGVVLSAVTLMTGAFVPATASAQNLQVPSSEPRYAAIVVDAATGEVLYARRADSPRYPASITKIMTLYLAFEELASGRLSPTDTITISPRAAAQPPTKLGLRAGETITVDDAVRAIALRSANDMAVALAEKIGGSESRFAALMTLRAQELGMANTRFVNASGLPDSRQVSSARDIAILSRSVMRDFPQYYGYFSQQSFMFRGERITNHNGLLGRMAGLDGLKTGFINASGYNLAASAVRDNHRLIAVVLGGSSTAARNNNVEMLLNTGFDIMRRRDNGENLLITQNLFEPAPAAPAIPSTPGLPQSGQVVLTEGPAPAGGLTIVTGRAGGLRPAIPVSQTYPADSAVGSDLRGAVSAPPPPRPPQAARAPAAGRYSIQVGAFRDRGQARSQLGDVTRRFAVVRGHRGDVGSLQGGYYRAQFGGFTQDDAKAACAALKAKRVSCMVIAP
ncbi:MAG: D-alanyl-D-alanine carboxypeptidase family protein [Caulobacteraceae bacterium]